MGPNKPFDVNGRQVQGRSLEFEPKAEPFSQYTLEDGTQVKVKIVLLDVVRLDDYNDQGDPVYQFQFQQLLGTVVPDELKRKKQ